MERGAIMSTSAYTQQLERINQILQEEISLLQSLPEEEAEILARKNLSELGLTDGRAGSMGTVAQKKNHV